MTHAQETGKRGEEIAAKYLEARDYKIFGRNVRMGRDEIDLVAYDEIEKMMVFVEVKSRTRRDKRYPMLAIVDARKRRCLARAITAWCIREEYGGAARLDVICVDGDRITDHVLALGNPFIPD